MMEDKKLHTQPAASDPEVLTLLKKTARDANISKWLSAAAAVLAAAALAVSLLRPAAGPAPAGTAQTVPAAPAVPAAQAAQGQQSLPAELDMDFDALWASVQQEQRQRLETPFDPAEISRVLVESEADANAITDQELDTLLQGHPRPASLTAEAAREDVDLLFRAFRSTYAAYYYFGEEEFANARQHIESQLPQSGSIDTAVFEELVSGAFAFLRDAHAGVFPQGAGVEYRPYENYLRQRYYYTGLYFQQDSEGSYITTLEGETWEFVRFYDPRVRMEPHLLPDGTLCYSPVLLSNEQEAVETLVVLQRGDAQQDLPLTWTQAQPYLDHYSSDPDYRQLGQNGVYYISERSFMGNNQILDRFAAEASALRDAKLIVFDIRSNGGGDDRYAAQWIRNFTGQDSQLNIFFASRSSKLTRQQGNSAALGTYQVFQNQGAVIPNDIPIVVLVDDRCGSSGESMLNDLRNLDNVIVVGSNSAGFQLCGNVVGLTLPNSGMIAQFGTSLSFQYSPESVDFAGYAPDIWCDPSTSLSAVWNMLVKYGRITPDQIPQESNTQLAQSAPDLTLLFQDLTIYPEEGFGTPDIGPHFLEVRLNGQKVSDYALQLGAEGVCDCQILPDGTLQLTRTGVGECPLIITVGDRTAAFRWYGGEEPPVPVTNCDMTLGYYDGFVRPGEGFGNPTPGLTHPLTVVLDGQVITDYQVENGNPAACSLEIDENGILQLTRLGPGGSEITVRTGSSWATFRWYGGEE